MAKLLASLTRKISVELADGKWESAEASFSIEDDAEPIRPDPKYPDAPIGYTSAGDTMRAFVKAQVDAEMKRQKQEIFNGVSAAEEFAAEVGGEVEYSTAPGRDPGVPGIEEKPPLPNEEVRVLENEYRRTFRIQSFEVAKTQNGDKYLKCFGKASWKRAWVPAWNDVAELLFGDIDDMDLGVIGPPYALEATVQMKDDEYKGKKFIAPDKVIEWTRIG